MAKKKSVKNPTVKHFIYSTRLGFYSLAIVASILMFSSIKMYSTFTLDQNVLGEKNTNEKAAQKSDSKNEQKREEKKEEIRSEFKVEPEKLQLKFERKGSIVERKVKLNNEPIDLDKKSESKLGDTIEKDFEIANETQIASESPDITIKKNNVKARSGFPLSIDVATNQLIVTRPDGTTKIVAILPDQAVQNFMTHKKVNLLNVTDPETGSGSAQQPGDTTLTPTPTDVSNETSTDSTEITLVEKDEKLVYKIKGKKKLKVFGLIPVNADTTGYVSSETGEVIDQEEGLVTRFLNLISL